MASLLRNNPTIYPEPRDAMLFLMVSRDQWTDGRWQVEGVPINNKHMPYNDLLPRAKPLHGTERLRDEVQALQRRLLDGHMDKILQDDPTQVYFRPTHLRDFRTLQLIEGGVPGNAPFLDFPDDIAPDWGRAIGYFHAWLEHELNNRHLLSPGAEDYNNHKIRAHWPEPALALYQSIDSARRRLHPLLHDGQSYEDYCQQRNELASRLVSEVLEEERQAKSVRPSP